MIPIVRNIVTAVLMAAGSISAIAETTISGDAISVQLGGVMAIQAFCNKPTAPVEAALERFVSFSQAEPSEAARLRSKMLAAKEYMDTLLTQNKLLSSCDGDEEDLRKIDGLFR